MQNRADTASHDLLHHVGHQCKPSRQCQWDNAPTGRQHWYLALARPNTSKRYGPLSEVVAYLQSYDTITFTLLTIATVQGSTVSTNGREQWLEDGRQLLVSLTILIFLLPLFRLVRSGLLTSTHKTPPTSRCQAISTGPGCTWSIIPRPCDLNVTTPTKRI